MVKIGAVIIVVVDCTVLVVVSLVEVVDVVETVDFVVVVCEVEKVVVVSIAVSSSLYDMSAFRSAVSVRDSG